MYDTSVVVSRGVCPGSATFEGGLGMLADYVRRVMEEKHLSAVQVQRNSGGEISDTYVLKIREGKVKRPSLSRLKGLAKGLGEPEERVMMEAGADVDQTRKKEWTAREGIELMSVLLTNEEVREGALALARMKPEDLKRAVKYLKRK